MKVLRALRSVRRRHLVVPAAVAAIVLTASVPAWAADPWPDEGWVITPPPLAAPAPAPRPRPPPERRWYGWQLITSDSLAVTVIPVLGLLADRNDGAPAAGLTVASYLVAPAVIHIAHGRAGIAAASLGLRLGRPLAGFLLGAVLVGKSAGDEGLSTFVGAGVGAAIGVLSASIVDAAALSWENPAPDSDEGAREDARRVAPKARPIAFTPVAGPRREGGFDVGVGVLF